MTISTPVTMLKELDKTLNHFSGNDEQSYKQYDKIRINNYKIKCTNCDEQKKLIQ